jgi:putative transposase
LTDCKAGLPLADVCRQHVVGSTSIYKWKANFGGLDALYSKSLRQFENENMKLRQLLAGAMLDNGMSKES